MAGTVTIPRTADHEDRLPMPALEFLLVSLFAAAVECALAYAMSKAPQAAFWVVLGHLALSILYGLWVLTVYRRDREWGLPALVALTLPVFGLLAPAAAIVVWPLHKWYARQAIPFEEWYASLFPEIRSSLAVDQYQAIVRGERGGDGAVAPFIDVLRRGTTDKKIAVIALLSKNFRPEFAPVLRMALSDDAAAIRVQAATAVAKIEDRFVKRAQTLEAELERSPDDLKVKRQLAELYDSYAFTGIMDAGRERTNRQKALDLWIEVFEADPGNAEAWIAVGRLLMRLRQHKVAARWFSDAIRTGNASAQVAAWYMEALFELGRSEELRDVARAYLRQIERARTELETPDLDVPHNVLEAARYWAGETPSRREDRPAEITRPGSAAAATGRRQAAG